MSKTNSQNPVCANHPNKIALGICTYHKKFLCFKCVAEKSSECSITEIIEISGEQDKVLHEWLLVRQIAIDNKRIIEDHENKTEALKNDLKKQVTDFHTQLMTSLNKTKEDCLCLIEEQAAAIIAKTHAKKQQLEIFEKENAEMVEKLCSETGSDVSGIQRKLQIVKSLLNEVPYLNEVLEGTFKADTDLKDRLTKKTLTLGKVLMCSQEYYEEIENKSDHNPELTNEVTGKEVKTESESIISVVSSSEEVTYTRATETEIQKQMNEPGEVIDSLNGNKEQEQKPCEKEEGEHNTNSKKKPWKFRSPFHRKRSASEKPGKDKKAETDRKEIKSCFGKETLTEAIYKDFPLETVQYNHPKYFINKTATIVGMEKHFRSACTFTKVVPLESGCFGLLSRAHGSIVVTSVDGSWNAKKTFSGLSDMVASGREELATIKIVDKYLQVIKYGVSNKKFEPLGDFIINTSIPRITGFDFDIASSMFAVSSPGKLVIFTPGKNERETEYPIGSTAETGEVMTTYDFNLDCIYLLDSQNRTLKCYSFSEANYLWKSQIDGQQIPRKMCLYKDKLCITYGNAIGIFNAKDGKPEVKHDTYDLLDDCDGLCVTDDIIVFSSNSSDFDTSTKLAFISM